MKSKPQCEARSDCPICVALENVGDAWSLLIVRGLMLEGRKSFKELLAAEEGIASNILSDRLQRLEASEIVEKRRDPDDARRYIYRLTEKGIDLAPVIVEMALWAAKYEKTAGGAVFVKQVSRNREGFIANIRKQWQAGNATGRSG